MKNKLLVVAMVVLALVGAGSIANATWNPNHMEMSVFGTVFQSGIDSDGDGLNGRSGHLQARGSVFAYMDTNIDVTTTFTQDECPAGQIALYPVGEVFLMTLSGENALFLTIDEDQYLCSGTFPEVITLTVGVFNGLTQQVESGDGVFANRTGTAQLTLPADVVARSNPITSEPQVVYAKGTLTVDLDQ